MTMIAPSAGLRVARGSAWNIGGHAIPLLFAIVTMPAVLRLIGPERFGLLTLAWAILGYFSLLDIGLGRAVTRFAAPALAERDFEQARTFVWSALGLQLALAIVLALLLFGCAGPIARLVVRTAPELASETTAGFQLLALALPFVLLFNAQRAVLEAAQKFATVNAIRIPFNSANFIIPYVAALQGASLPRIVGLLVITRAAAFAVQAAALAIQLPQLNRPSIELSAARTMLRFGAAVMVSNVISPLLVYLDRFVLSAIIAVAVAGYYAAPSEIVYRLLIVPGSIAAAVFPFVSTSSRISEEVMQVVRSAFKYIWLILLPVLGLIALFADVLLTNWIGAAPAAYVTTASRILCAGGLVSALAQLPFAVLHGYGRADLTARFHLVEAVLYVPLLILLVRSAGATGAAAAWTARVTLDAALLFVAARRVADVSFWTLGAARRALLLACIYILMIIWLIVAPLVLGTAALLAAAGTAAFAIIGWRWILEPNERALSAITWRSRE